MTSNSNNPNPAPHIFNEVQQEGGLHYRITLPQNYDPKKKYYLAIGMHGLDARYELFSKTFAHASLKHNIIFVSLRGNLPSKAYKNMWGYRKSVKYILKCLEVIKRKYHIKEKTLLFGYSQGGHQGLYTTLLRPKTFSHFAVISGGHTNLSPQQFKNSLGKKIHFIHGNFGDIEKGLAILLNHRIAKLKKHGAIIQRTIMEGQEHKDSYLYNPDLVFTWFLNQIKNEKPIEDKF